MVLIAAATFSGSSEGDIDASRTKCILGSFCIFSKPSVDDVCHGRGEQLLRRVLVRNNLVCHGYGRPYADSELTLVPSFEHLYRYGVVAPTPFLQQHEPPIGRRVNADQEYLCILPEGHDFR